MTHDFVFTHIRILKLCRRYSVALLLVSLAGTLLDIWMRWYSGVLLDEIGQGQWVNSLPIFIVGILATIVLLKFMTPYLTERLNARLQCILYGILFRKTLEAEQSELEKQRLGAAGTIFSSDINGIIQYAKRMLTVLFPDLFMFTASAILILSIDIGLGMATIASALLPVYVMLWMSKVLVKGNMRYQEALDQVNHNVASSFYNIEFIKANMMQDVLEEENQGVLENLQSIRRQVAGKEAFLSIPALFSSFLTVIVIAIWGGYLVIQGTISGGELFTVILLIDYVVSPVMRFENSVGQIRKASAYLKRMNAYMQMQNEETKADQYVPSAYLGFESATFGYSENEEVFSELNIQWSKGKLNCVIGGNGKGKTTMLKLICGLYQLQAGKIHVPFAFHSLEDIRNHIVVQTQESIVFEDTIFRNITCGRELASSMVYRICREIGIDEEISTFPQGYETELRAEGAPLSGGQKRRICFARSLLCEADVYIFDEPTAGVDPKHVDQMLACLKKLAQDKLVLVISHDPQVIEAAQIVTDLEVMDGA